MNIESDKINNNLVSLLQTHTENAYKYFYIVGDAEKHTTYFDEDTGMSFPDVETIGKGWRSDKFNTFQEVINDIMYDGYDHIYEKVNFPKQYDYLEEVDEKDCTPKQYPRYKELLSYWCCKEEDFGDDYREINEYVNRLIEICKENE